MKNLKFDSSKLINFLTTIQVGTIILGVSSGSIMTYKALNKNETNYSNENSYVSYKPLYYYDRYDKEGNYIDTIAYDGFVPKDTENIKYFYQGTNIVETNKILKK